MDCGRRVVEIWCFLWVSIIYKYILYTVYCNSGRDRNQTKKPRRMQSENLAQNTKKINQTNNSQWNSSNFTGSQRKVCLPASRIFLQRCHECCIWSCIFSGRVLKITPLENKRKGPFTTKTFVKSWLIKINKYLKEDKWSHCLLRCTLGSHQLCKIKGPKTAVPANHRLGLGFSDGTPFCAMTNHMAQDKKYITIFPHEYWYWELLLMPAVKLHVYSISGLPLSSSSVG